jgi:alkylhydroperoxidase family enzyme
VERFVLAYTDALVLSGGRVSDATFAALQEELADEEILELTYTVALYHMQAIMSRALRLESDDRDDPIIERSEP